MQALGIPSIPIHFCIRLYNPGLHLYHSLEPRWHDRTNPCNGHLWSSSEHNEGCWALVHLGEMCKVIKQRLSDASLYFSSCSFCLNEGINFNEIKKNQLHKYCATLRLAWDTVVMSCQMRFFIIAKQANPCLTPNQPLSVKCMVKRCSKRMLSPIYMKEIWNTSVLSLRDISFCGCLGCWIRPTDGHRNVTTENVC